ncbi:hypothetical protein CP532_3719 [Ophiocordyceps camponoti-leonardi (nom. inval.)]|nr:hypothetical protein CP532_3719 [Ophiocordyceps camponoti-leonardi (nom. inval.)]
MVAGPSSYPRPPKRQKVTPSTTTSHYFSQPSHGDGELSDHSSPHDHFKSKTSVGTRSPSLKTSLPQSKFKSSSGKKRLRRSRSGKEAAHVSISPGSDDRKKSAGGSPDVLAIDPPPANVVSDVLSYSRLFTRSGKTTKTSSKSQGPARPARKASESEDELTLASPKQKRQTNFNKVVDTPRQAATRGDIAPTSFKKTLAAVPQEQTAIGVRRAVLNKKFCEREQGQSPVRLLCRQISARIEPKSVLVPENCDQEGLGWLRIDIEAIKNLKHSDRRLIFCHPNGKLFLELDTVQDCNTFLSLIALSKVEIPGHYDVDVDKIFERNFEKVKEYAHKSVQASEPTQSCEPEDDEKTPWSATRITPKVQRLIDKLQSAAPRTTEEKIIAPPGKPEVVRPANMATRFRQTRNSLSAATNSLLTPTVVSPKIERWTKQNPTWRERWERSLMYPATGKNRTTVDDDDIPRLDEGEFLNDNLISFYLRHLEINLEAEKPELRKKVYIFSTFFFEKLRSTRGKINYDGVKAWTAKFDLFSYDYIIVPVNEHAHWYLAIICNVPYTLSGIPAEDGVEVIEVPEEPIDSSVASECTMTAAAKPSNGTTPKSNLWQPKIITLDSLGSQHSSTTKALKEYLIEEAKDKKNAELALMPNGMKAKDVPMQNNFCDCGLFVLGYVEEFLKDPDGNARKLLQKEDLGWEMQPWKLRTRIRELLFDLQQQQKDRLIREKAQKQKSSPSRKAAQGKKRVAATGSAAASASACVDTSSSDTDTGTGTAIQLAPPKSMRRSGSESSPCVVHDDTRLESKFKYVEALSDSDSSNSTSTEKHIHRSARTSPGDRHQKGEASVATDSTVVREAVQGVKRFTLTEAPLPLISTLSSSSPMTIRGDDASRLVPSIEMASPSSLDKDQGTKITPSGPGVPAQQPRPTAASLLLGSRATYGGIDRTVDLT